MTGSTAGRAYCTYFNSAFAGRGQLMVSSLRARGEQAPVWIVCFDQEAREQVAQWDLPAVTAIGLDELLARYPELGGVRHQRSPAEFFFTCTPWVHLWALGQSGPGTLVTYLDADLWFLGPPAELLDEIGPADLAIVPSRYLPGHEGLMRFGRYNVGWVSARNNEAGIAVVQWWAQRCLEWCRDTVVGGRFADQGYLDRFPDLCPNTCVITHPGANVGPWDAQPERIGMDGTQLLVDGRTLVFFHFHGLRRIGDEYRAMHIPFGTRATGIVAEAIYRPYVQALGALDATAIRPARRGGGWRGCLGRARRRWYYARAGRRGESWAVNSAGTSTSARKSGSR